MQSALLRFTVNGDTFVEGDPCLVANCPGNLVARTASPTVYRQSTPMLSCSNFERTGCRACVFPNRVRLGSGSSTVNSATPKREPVKQEVVVIDVDSDSHTATRRRSSSDTAAEDVKVIHPQITSRLVRPNAPRRPATSTRAGFIRRGARTRADGTRTQRYVCKHPGCGGSFYVPLNANDEEIAGEEYTGRPCNHEAGPAQVDRSKLDPGTRNMIASELRKGATPAGVKLLLNSQGIAVQGKQIKSVSQQLREDTNGLLERLGKMDGVDSIVLRFRNTAGLFVLVIWRPLLAAVAIGSISHVFLDGTRNIGPHGTQLVAFLALLACGTVVPMGFLITQGAHQDNYEYFALQLRDVGFSPRYIHVDFERAEHLAVSSVWPKANIVGCYFHFQQACMKRWRKLYGARTTDKTWSEVHKFLQRAASATRSEDFKMHIRALRDFLRVNKKHEFWNYFHNQWIKKVHPRLWSLIEEQDSEATRVRTNNYAEGFNQFLKTVAFDRRKFLSVDTVCQKLIDVLKARHTELIARDPADVESMSSFSRQEQRRPSLLTTWALARTMIRQVFRRTLMSTQFITFVRPFKSMCVTRSETERASKAHWASCMVVVLARLQQSALKLQMS